MSKTQAQLITLFEVILPKDRILTSQADCEQYGRDASKEVAGKASIVLLPSSIDEITKIVRTCHEKKIGLVPSGGRTGYSGGATAIGGEVVLSLEKLRKILEVDPTSRTLTCEAGATTESVIEAAKQHDLFYPVDFASKGSAQIGGNIATNAGGIRVVRHGTTRNWVLGLSVITPAFGLLKLGSKLIKNQTGPDLKELFIGSEGILGVIIEATLKLTDKASDTVLSLCAVSGIKDAQSIIAALRKQGSTISLAEYFEQNALSLVCEVFNKKPPFSKSFPAYLLLEVDKSDSDGNKHLLDNLVKLSSDGLISDCIVSQSIEQYRDLLSYREGISEAIRMKHYPHKNDIALPLGSLEACLEKLPTIIKNVFPESDVITFGHLGDGNLHVNILKPSNMSEEEFRKSVPAADEALISLLISLGGTTSAEHGIGALKTHYMPRLKSPAEMAALKAIKSQFDPNGVMNPGKVL